MMRLFFVVLTVVLGQNMLLAGLDNMTYMNLQIRTKELTLSALRKQRQCLESSECNTQKLIKILEENQEEIARVYKEEGTTPSESAKYYTEHKKELDRLYRESNYAARLQELQNAIEEEDEKINALRGGEE